MKSWDQVRTLDDQTGWAELTENGWGALLAWVAAPGNARRLPATDDGRTVRVITRRAGVADERSDEPFTAQDRDLIEDGVNSYLADAGVPPRPRGYTWFVRVYPPNLTPDEFMERINGAVLDAPPEIVAPAQWRERMATILRGTYGDRS